MAVLKSTRYARSMRAHMCQIPRDGMPDIAHFAIQVHIILQVVNCEQCKGNSCCQGHPLWNYLSCRLTSSSILPEFLLTFKGMKIKLNLLYTLTQDTTRGLISQFGQKPMGYCASKLPLSASSRYGRTTTRKDKEGQRIAFRVNNAWLRSLL